MSRHLERGCLLLDLGRVREAASELAKGAALPGDEQAHALALLALTEMEGGSLQFAAEHLARARMLDPTSAVVRWAGAVLAAREGDLARMDHELLALRLSDPSDPVRIGLTALLHHGVDDFETALSIANEGLALDPNNEDCLSAAAAACTNLGKQTQGHAFAERLLHINPLLAQGHVHLARRALAADDLAAAAEHARSALRIDPHEINAHVVLLRTRAITHWFYKALSGRIANWTMPVWQRVSVLFLPFVLAIVISTAIERDLPSWVDRIVSPAVLVAAWIACFFAWITWYFSVRALWDQDARRAMLATLRDLLIPGTPATIVLVSVILHVVAGFNVTGVVFTTAILGFALLAIFSRRPAAIRPWLFLALGGLFLLSVAGQVADQQGVTWAAPALFGMILVLAAALPILLLVSEGKSSSTPPPLPPAHESPSLPR